MVEKKELMLDDARGLLYGYEEEEVFIYL